MGNGYLLLHAGISAARGDSDTPGARNDAVSYGQITLPPGIRSRQIDTGNGVVLHVLESGFESPGGPCVVLLHGFPELAYTWRRQMLPLARAGFHVLAPDLRGYGLSALQPVAYAGSLLPYTMRNRVGDVVGLVRAAGLAQVFAVIGHDWGGPTAAWCARSRPDLFKSVVSISTPFLSGAKLPEKSVRHSASSRGTDEVEAALAALPRPRKHYFSFCASPEANEDLWHAPQGVHDLLRELYYFKSADWRGNHPFPLTGWTASELAKMPTYYVMDLDQGMAATLAEHQPSAAEIAACRWMTEADLQVFASQFSRTGFQGGLNYYRADADESIWAGLDRAGKTIDVPACYIGGAKDWAVYQSPGAYEAMHTVCTQLTRVHLVPNAGHSIVEERADAVNARLLEFLRTI